MKRLIEIYHYILWLLTDRCMFCGGDLENWSDKKSFCRKCGREQR